MRPVAVALSSVIFLGGMMSCATPDEDFSLAHDGDEAWADRQARMNITLRVQTPLGEVEREVAPQEFRTTLRDECVVIRDSGAPAAPHTGCFSEDYSGLPPSCQLATCASNLLLCMSHRARELAEILEPTDLRAFVDGYSASIVPQDMASQAGLNELALQLAQEAMGIAGENLRRGTGSASITYDQNTAVCLPTDMKTVPLGGQGAPLSHGDSLAFDLAEARHLVEEAGNAAVEANIAVADAEFSLRGDPGAAARDAWSAPALSRLHGAELLVGVPNTVVARPTIEQTPLLTSAAYASFVFLRNGHCSSSPPGISDRAAMDFLRNAGPPPDVTFDPDVTFAELYEGAGSYAGLRDSLAQITGLPEFAGTPGGPPPLGPEEFLEAYGLTDANFLAARTRMREEYAAFGRDPGARLPPLALPPDPMTGDPRVYSGRYVATSLPPVAPSASFYVRLARSHVGASEDRDGSTVTGAVRPGSAYARRSVAHAIDYAISTAYATLGDGDFSNETTEILGQIIDGSIESRTARLETCYFRTDTHRVRGRLYTDIPPSDLLLVEGSAGLSCATRGNVEGAPCVLADHIASVAGATTTVGRNLGFPRRVEWDLTDVSSAVPVDYYVVRRRPGAPTNGSGSYEDVAPLYFDAFVATPETAGLQFCNALPVVPSATLRVQSGLLTDEENCEVPEAPCGVLSDPEIPLENELIDDGNGFESSWRYHLDRARAAAEHADQLAEEMIESGFEIERRADAANEALLQACGVTVSLDGLFGEDGGPSVTTGACPVGGDGITIGGRCVRRSVRSVTTDGATDRDARVLAECLGDDAVVPLVSLGTNRLCVWRRIGDPGLICEGATHTNRCPYLVNEAGGCDPRGPEGASPGAYESVAVTEALGFFGLDGDGTSSTIAARPDCELIRTLRTPGVSSGVRASAIRDLIDSNFYYVGNVADWARRIAWEARPVNFAAVSVDGSPWIQTGDQFTAGRTSPYWPCTSATPTSPVRACLPGEGSLFCGQVACGDTSSRTAFNHRLASAALFLAITSNAGVGNFVFPLRHSSPVYDDGVDAFLGFADLGLRRQGSLVWEIGTRATVGDDEWPGTVIANLTGTLGEPLWTSPSSGVSVLRPPIAFVRLGELRGRSEERATAASRELWAGMSRGLPADGTRGALGFSQRVLDALIGRRVQVVEGTEWRRGELCTEGCLPNSRDLSEFWEGPLYSLAIAGGTLQLPFTFVGETLDQDDALDGLELMCEAARAVEDGTAGRCDMSRPPDVATRSDLPRMRQFLLCAANEVELQGERAVLQSLPSRVVAEWTQDGSPGMSRSDSGALGDASNDLREALLELSGTHRLVAGAVRDIEAELQIMELRLADLDSRREVADLETLSRSINQVAACASAGSVNGALATCANAVAQIAISFRLRDITREMLAREGMQLLVESIDRLQDHGDALAELADRIASLVNRANSALSRYEAARANARRAFANALGLGSLGEGTSIPINDALHNRYELRAYRYRAARRDAIRLTEVAKRALEQRLGTRLEDLHGLTLVEDPSGWAGELCSASGVDYSRLRDETGLPFETEEFLYVGDYVRRLELVFDSYRFDYPFSSATDTAVVSLRDDVRNLRTECVRPTYNLLAAASDLTRAAWSSDEEACIPVPEVPEGTTTRIIGCAAARGIDATLPAGTAFADVPRLGAAGAFRVVFAEGATGPGGPGVSFTPDASYGQELSVATGGTYLLSWYGRASMDAAGRDPSTAVQLVGASGVPFASSAPLSVSMRCAAPAAGEAACEMSGMCTWACTSPTTCACVASAWRRYFRFYSVPTSQTVRVEVIPQAPLPTSGSEEQFVDLAAVQLEDATGLVTAPVGMITQSSVDADTTGALLPRAFVATTDQAGYARLGLCEDTRGVAFRGGWRYDCERICPAGFERGCTDADRVEQCFREIEVRISEEQLERGEVLGRAGFATGNFNYRTERVGLNFVGTGARTCEDESLPSTCYSSGFIPYSLYHYPLGAGYPVRNHSGAIYAAQLFTGRIEHADGLAAERYVTNPLGSADRSLIEPYMRPELIGRPLPGRYILRVWDAPGVNFEGIEDIQLVLDYRFWTRLD